MRNRSSLGYFVARFALGVLAVLLATLVQSLLWPWVGPSRFIVYYPAIIFSSLFGGLITGIVATVFGMFAAEYFFFPPHYTFGPYLGRDFVPLAIFFVSGGAISLINSLLQRRRDQLQVSEATRKSEEIRLQLLDLIEKERDTLRYQLSLNQNITTQAAEAILVTDKDGRVVSANREAELQFGFSAQELIGRNVHDVFHHHYPDGRQFPEEQCELAAGYLRQATVRDSEQVFFKKDGSGVDVSCSISPLTVEGRAFGAVLLVRNISERKQIEEGLRSAIRTRDDFLSIASHELKTPLTSLLLQTEFRQRNLKRGRLDGFSPERLKDGFEADYKQLERLSRLVDDMLDVSRINSGRLSIHKERFDLCALAREQIEQYASGCRRSGCRIQATYCGPIWGDWDRNRIEQIFANLLSNAIKYGGGTPITVTVERVDNSAKIHVRDEGRGIPKADQERIFRRFERGVKGGEISGLGLGLYIVKNIVRLHGGNIRVESEVDQGATFVVTLPVAAGGEQDEKIGPAG